MACITPWLQPLAQIRGIALELDTRGLAEGKKPERLPTHKPHPFRIKRNVGQHCFGVEQLLQSWHAASLKLATETEDRQPFVVGSSNLQHVIRLDGNWMAFGKFMKLKALAHSEISEIRKFTKFGISRWESEKRS